jgi:hypothetical protein
LEIKEGEESLQDRGDGRLELRTLLGLDGKSSEPASSDGRGQRRSANRVGRRRPARDQVGQGEGDE